MPITKTITLYKFDELSEEAQNNALSKLWDINVDNDWWEHILDEEYDYLTSKEAIKETIEANEYLFDVDGTLEY